MQKKTQMSKKISRRGFMGSAAVAAFTFLPRHVLGGRGYTPPSETVMVAGVGIGGMGSGDLRSIARGDAKIVALCDVDQKYAAKTFRRYPDAKVYVDYRKMLEKERNIDAVMVATPDHTHAVVSMAAIKRGKHVYCEKPLTHSIYEARKIKEAAAQAKVATQMGNQGHSGEGIRLTCEWIWDGAIGTVREAHGWSDTGYWTRGLRARPQKTPPVPATLNWDLWLGPAPSRPYHPIYTPYNWRGWWDFGTAAIGDMACHNMDPAFWALKLGHPTTIEARSSHFTSETVADANIIRYQFPAREDMPPVTLTWYDGGLMPPRPEEMEPGRKMGSNGILFIGDKGKIICGGWAGSPRLIPETKMREYSQKRPPRTLARSPGHRLEWVNACKGGAIPHGNFDYSAHLAEVVLLGNIAVRTGEKIQWDGPNMKATNAPEADKYIKPAFREGWSL